MTESKNVIWILFLHFSVIFVCFLTACAKGEGVSLIDDDAIADKTRTSEWLAYGGTHYEQRFSPLEDININTVSKLRVDWFIDLPDDVGLVSTPLVVDGILYFTGTMNIVLAVNAVSGKRIWEFDPEVGKHVGSKRKLVGPTTEEFHSIKAKYL